MRNLRSKIRPALCPLYAQCSVKRNSFGCLDRYYFNLKQEKGSIKNKRLKGKMASGSDFDVGILGVKKPLDCSCQELLSTPKIVLNGWLRKRSLRNKVITMNWPQFYVIVANQCLYYFNNEMSKKAAGSVSLYGFNRICRASRVKVKDVVWAFKLEHIQPSFPSLYFSASSEKDMIKWMSVIKQEMLSANDRGGNKSAVDSQYGESIASEDSWGSRDYKQLESSIYEQPISCRPISTFSDYSEAVDSDFEDDHVANKAVNFEPSLADREIPSAPSISDTAYSFEKCNLTDDGSPDRDYWNAVRFDGSKVDASRIINNISQNGVFLLRKSDDDSTVLIVYANGVKKFKIISQTNGRLTLSSKTEPDFEYVEELLYHYYSKELPNCNQKLVCPFQLHDDYSEN